MAAASPPALAAARSSLVGLARARRGDGRGPLRLHAAAAADAGARGPEPRPGRLARRRQLPRLRGRRAGLQRRAAGPATRRRASAWSRSAVSTLAMGVTGELRRPGCVLRFVAGVGERLRARRRLRLGDRGAGRARPRRLVGRRVRRRRRRHRRSPARPDSSPARRRSPARVWLVLGDDAAPGSPRSPGCRYAPTPAPRARRRPRPRSGPRRANGG